MYDTSDNTSIFSFIKMKNGVIDPTRVPKINRPRKYIKSINNAESDNKVADILNHPEDVIKNTSIEMFLKKKDELQNLDQPKRKIQMRLKGSLGQINENQALLNPYHSDENSEVEHKENELVALNWSIKQAKSTALSFSHKNSSESLKNLDNDQKENKNIFIIHHCDRSTNDELIKKPLEWKIPSKINLIRKKRELKLKNKQNIKINEEIEVHAPSLNTWLDFDEISF